MKAPRRRIALTLLPLLALPACSIASAEEYAPLPGPSASATPRVFAAVGGGQIAEAVWLVRRPGRLVIFIAAAFRGADAGYFGEPFAGVEAFGIVGRGVCRRREHGYRCRGRLHGREIPPTDFQADPLLRSAELRMRAAGRLNVARWEGQGTLPRPDWGGAFGSAYFFGGADAGRESLATARILGRRVGQRRVEYAYLLEGAGSFVFVEPRLGTFGFDRRFTPSG